MPDESPTDDTDITRLILDDHDAFRRGFAALDDLLGPDGAARPDELSAVWRPLADLLDVHAVAEERIFYPQLLARGADAEDETVDAVRDHNEIRDAVREAQRHPVGSQPWWQAVNDARAANTEHMGEEEDDALADFRRHAPMELRRRLGGEFAAFKARHPDPAHLDTSDQDPDEYVAVHRPAPADGSLGIGSLRADVPG